MPNSTICTTHRYTRLDHQDQAVSVDDLAACLADRIMCFRCRGRPSYYEAWRRKVDTGESPKASTLRELGEGFIKGAFGLPDGSATVPDDHLQGLVAQYLWYFVIQEIQMFEPLEDIQPVGFRAIDHGGDSLTLHRINASELRFRLWEIKKATRKARVNSTIRRACRQLVDRALEYLAEFTPVAEHYRGDDPEKAEIYGQLLELWLQNSPKAAAGVSVATSVSKIPKGKLEDLGKHMPGFTQPLRLEGLLNVLGDFEDFAEKVQQHIWKGL